MYFLSLETSTKILSLCLSRDERVLRFRNVKTARLLENSIIRAIDKICIDAKIKFAGIDAFVVALGPGSFTSLRVGLATVKAFCLATAKPVVGIGSLDVIAAGITNQSCDEICVINDARRGNVYAAIYDNKAKRKGECMLITINELLKQVQGKTLFVGDGLGVYRGQIEDVYRQHSKAKASSCQAIFALEKYWYPQAKVLAHLAYARLKQNDYDDAATILPIYLYAQDCQVTPKASSLSTVGVILSVAKDLNGH